METPAGGSSQRTARSCRCRITDIWTSQPSRRSPRHYARRRDAAAEGRDGPGDRVRQRPLRRVRRAARPGGLGARRRRAAAAARPRPARRLGARARGAGRPGRRTPRAAGGRRTGSRRAASGGSACRRPCSASCCAAALCAVADRAGDKEAGRFGLLRWAFVAVAPARCSCTAAGWTRSTAPVAVLAVLANVALVYYLFKVSRRGYGSTVAERARALPRPAQTPASTARPPPIGSANDA